jgi:hypothetical protein
MAPAYHNAVVAADFERIIAARIMADVLTSNPSVDQDQGEMMTILRALTERCPTSNHLVTTVPIELLSEWAYTALYRRDCALLGRAMTIAAACGHSLNVL